MLDELSQFLVYCHQAVNLVLAVLGVPLCVPDLFQELLLEFLVFITGLVHVDELVVQVGCSFLLPFELCLQVLVLLLQTVVFGKALLYGHLVSSDLIDGLPELNVHSTLVRIAGLRWHRPCLDDRFVYLSQLLGDQSVICALENLIQLVHRFDVGHQLCVLLVYFLLQIHRTIEYFLCLG